MVSPAPNSVNRVRLDSQMAIGYLIAAGGDSKLAAVRATRELGEAAAASNSPNPEPITEAQLLMTVAADPNSLAYLSNQVRLLAILQTLNSLKLTQIAFHQLIPKLSARDAAQTYTRLLESMSALSERGSAPPPNADNILTQLNGLPTAVVDAVRYFIEHPDAKVLPDGASSEELFGETAPDDGSDSVVNPTIFDSSAGATIAGVTDATGGEGELAA